MTPANTTVDEYLAALPADRRASVERVRAVVLENLPDGYRESMGNGMIAWCVPLETYPNTYNGQPLCYAALASQKNYMSLYLIGAYTDPKQRARLEQAYQAAGKRLDMGQSCLRFRSADELPLDTIGEVIGSMPPADFIAISEANRAAAKGTAAKKTKQAAKK